VLCVCVGGGGVKLHIRGGGDGDSHHCLCQLEQPATRALPEADMWMLGVWGVGKGL
jgi:hypothetical protein